MASGICPECGRDVGPHNLNRHLGARHPDAEAAPPIEAPTEVVKPLAPRQVEILKYLKSLEDSDNPNDLLYHYPASPASIAQGIGITDRPRRTRGPWSGNQNPAQHIISALTGLANRGLITHGNRPNGDTGSAYQLTEAGREAIA